MNMPGLIVQVGGDFLFGNAFTLPDHPQIIFTQAGAGRLMFVQRFRIGVVDDLPGAGCFPRGAVGLACRRWTSVYRT